jgi:hypothetical protein
LRPPRQDQHHAPAKAKIAAAHAVLTAIQGIFPLDRLLDARAIAIAGRVRTYLVHEMHSALNFHARAIELNPNLPLACALSSRSSITASTLPPSSVRPCHARCRPDPHIFFVEHALMATHFFSHHLEEAEMLATEIVLQRNPRHASALNVRLAILRHMRRYAEAAECLMTLREIDPKVSMERTISRLSQAHRRRSNRR